VLLSALATAAYFILSKRLLRHYSAIEFTCYAIWAGTVPMLVFAPSFARQFQHAAPSATLAVVYLGIFPAAIAYVLSNYALARMPASLMTTFLYLSPVLAALIAWCGSARCRPCSLWSEASWRLSGLSSCTRADRHAKGPQSEREVRGTAPQPSIDHAQGT